MPTRKSKDGVFWKRDFGVIVWSWRLMGETSKKIYATKTECAMKYVERYVEKNPKYKDILLDKTWDQIFQIFGIAIP